jgi:hypothetical protein
MSLPVAVPNNLMNTREEFKTAPSNVLIVQQAECRTSLEKELMSSSEGSAPERILQACDMHESNNNSHLTSLFTENDDEDLLPPPLSNNNNANGGDIYVPLQMK